MWYLAIAGLVNFIACLSFGSFILLRNPRNLSNRTYFYFNLTVAYYNLFYFIWQLSGSEIQALPWMKQLMVGTLFINPAFLHFVFSFLDLAGKKRWEIIINYFITAYFVYANLTGAFYTGLERVTMYGYWPVIKPFFTVYLVFWFCQVLYTFFWLVRGWTMTTGIRREQIKYVTVACIVGFGAGVFNWPLWYRIPIPPFSHILISAHIFMMAYSMIRFKVLNVAKFTAQSVFAFVYVCLLAALFLSGYLSERWLLTAALCAALGGIAPWLHRFLVFQTEKQLLSSQKSYQQMLKHLAHQMLRYHDSTRLLNDIVSTCATAVGLEGAYFLTHDKSAGRYVLVASSGDGAGSTFIEDDHALVKLLSKREYMNFETIRLAYERSEINGERGVLLQFSDQLGVSLVFGVRVKKMLTGLLALGPKKNKAIFTQDDIEMFNLLSCQSALALENCDYLERIRELYQKAFSDELTGCHNRTFYEEYLKRTVAASHRNGTALHVCIVDLDNFKHINDTYGHDAGDKILTSVGRLLRASCRDSDVVIRYGGDEFVVCLEGIEETAMLAPIIDRLLTEMRALRVKAGPDGALDLCVTASIGVASLQPEQTHDILVKAADSALYEAKKAGKNRSVIARVA